MSKINIFWNSLEFFRLYFGISLDFFWNVLDFLEFLDVFFMKFQKFQKKIRVFNTFLHFKTDIPAGPPLHSGFQNARKCKKHVSFLEFFWNSALKYTKTQCFETEFQRNSQKDTCFLRFLQFPCISTGKYPPTGSAPN